MIALECHIVASINNGDKEWRETPVTVRSRSPWTASEKINKPQVDYDYLFANRQQNIKLNGR
jgi:hypothetical protein